MASESLIEWTETTWNPVTGCTKVSPGCKFCYADTLAKRLHKFGNPRYENGFKLTLHPDLIDQPKSWRKPRVVFVNSMSDLLHEQVDFRFIRSVFASMNEANHHVYQVLTKRGDRLARIGPALPWDDHIWMGVSVEGADPYNSEGHRPTDRIDQLRASGARVKFLSCEPLIGPLPDLDLTDIDWVIVGGESGKGARPMEEDWALDVVRQCKAAGVPVFVKQMGKVWAQQNGVKGDQKGGRMEEWPADLQVREWPSVHGPLRAKSALSLWSPTAADAGSAPT